MTIFCNASTILGDGILDQTRHGTSIRGEQATQCRRKNTMVTKKNAGMLMPWGYGKQVRIMIWYLAT
jgi:hypothetical protein